MSMVPRCSDQARKRLVLPLPAKRYGLSVLEAMLQNMAKNKE
jgi:hypothetical protein